MWSDLIWKAQSAFSSCTREGFFQVMFQKALNFLEPIPLKQIPVYKQTLHTVHEGTVLS